MIFAEVDQRYLALKQEFAAGALSTEEFDEALRSLMIQDELGRWWAKARDSGQWHFYDAVTERWMPAAPPQSIPPPVMAPQPGSMERATTSQPSALNSVEVQRAQPAPWHGDAAPGIVQPELSPALKIVFYIISFLVPIAGIVLFFVYRSKPAPEDRAAAKLFLILGIVAFALSCVCPFVFSILVALAGV